MNIPALAWKNLRYRPWTAGIGVLLMALGCALVLVTMQTERQLNAQFTRNLEGTDMVLGAQGSPLQLILSAVLQVDDPTGNMPLDMLHLLRRHPHVEQALPLAYGDQYRGWRILGTEPEAYAQWFGAELLEGRLPEAPFEVLAGSQAAARLELQLGQRFHSSHGLIEADHAEEHEHDFTVVGILDASGSVADRLLLCDLQSVWDSHGDPGADSLREITATLIRFRNAMGMMSVPTLAQSRGGMQTALPALEIDRLLQQLGVGLDSLRLLSWILFGAAGLSVLIALMASWGERRRELALLRSLGARPMDLFGLVLAEAVWICLGGALLGIVLGRLGSGLLGQAVDEAWRVQLDPWAGRPEDLWVLGVALGMALLAAAWPATQALRIAPGVLLGEED